MSNVTIRDIRFIGTAPAGINLGVVKVETSEPGLYGLGCATFAYRILSVQSMIEDYFKPLLVGRDVADIDDIWQIMNHNSYWRNGPVTNNAISGVDMALWDIKGKMANMPVYDLLGGRVRKGIPIYSHTGGETISEAVKSCEKMMEKGVRYIRTQVGGYGGGKNKVPSPRGATEGQYLNIDKYLRETVELFKTLRSEVGNEIELCHDVHERVPAIEGVRLAKYLEEYRLFFLEDILAPEQGEWFRQIRATSTTPIAQGELFNNPKEWDYLIANRLIDFIRCHISQIGGITPARKLAILCETFGVRTAWHGPGDVSPIGHVANLQVDAASWSFGIQEWSFMPEILFDVFPGCPEYGNDGYMYLNDKPGLGIDIDEEKAAKYPCDNGVTRWTQTRLPDGTFVRP